MMSRFILIFIFSPLDTLGEGIMFSGYLSATFVHLFGQILLAWYLMNHLGNRNETYVEYSLASTDDLVRFRWSKVRVTAGCQGGEGIHVDTGELKSIF